MSSTSLTKLAQALLSYPEPVSSDIILKFQKQFPSPHGLYGKTAILKAVKHLASQTGVKPNSSLLKALTLRPIRTASGVAPVTLLTKPYPCPGKCIFCPSDVRMPKSYLSMEPGAQRAANNRFDPYLQTYNRLQAYQDMGHPCDKAEILVLGGTWTAYPLSYRIWFVKRIFDALNDYGTVRDQRRHLKGSLDVSKVTNPLQGLTHVAHHYTNYNQAVNKLYGKKLHRTSESATWSELTGAQHSNESAQVRCVGLVLETRPDFVTVSEVRNLRRLGATKMQLGIQSLDDDILKRNKRGHGIAETAQAMKLLRLAGFKLHVHWMPNLLGATPRSDQADYHKLFTDPRFRPDEIKIYPCSLIDGTELMDYYQDGSWQPYTRAQLLTVSLFTLSHTPRYCRITRMIRDIPGTDIVAGNKTTNFRQLAQVAAQKSHLTLKDIRAREIRHQTIAPNQLKLKTTRYRSSVGTEYFLEWVTPTDQIVAFLRLTFPQNKSNPITHELTDSALIREVHVYGHAVSLKTHQSGAAQHTGLGRKLISKAAIYAKKRGYHKLSVISAIGTRPYYAKLGFSSGKRYQHFSLTK